MPRLDGIVPDRAFSRKSSFVMFSAHVRLAILWKGPDIPEKLLTTSHFPMEQALQLHVQTPFCGHFLLLVSHWNSTVCASVLLSNCLAEERADKFKWIVSEMTSCCDWFSVKVGCWSGLTCAGVLSAATCVTYSTCVHLNPMQGKSVPPVPPSCASS